MGEVVALRAAQYIEHHDPLAEGRRVAWGCMDERSFVDLSNMHNGLYRQYAGSPDGFGRDVAVTMEVRQRGSSFGHRRPLHVLGGIVADAARAEGIDLLLHESCASETKAPEAGSIVVTRPDDTFQRTRLITPDIEPSQFDRIRGVHLALQKEDSYAPALQVAQDYRDGVPGHFEPVERLDIIKMDHVAADVLVNDQRRTAFRPGKAMGDPQGPNAPAYHISLGDLPEVHAPISDIIPIDFDTFRHAAAVRHAAVTLALEEIGGIPLTVHRVSELRKTG